MKPLKPFEIEYSGINLVEASAGTGKTYNITSLYIRALIELEVSVGQILVVTYTEAATKELKDRLLKRIRQSVSVLREGAVEDESDQFLHDLLHQVDDRDMAVDRLQKAVRTFDESAIYTIHGFCYQALQEQAFESRVMYDAELIGDDSELVLEVVDDYWRNWVAEASSDPQKRPLLQYLSRQGCDPDALAQELGSYVGQAHLHVLPNEIPTVEQFRDEVSRLKDIFSEMKTHWQTDGAEIREMVKADQLDGRIYQPRNLDSWIGQLDEFLQHEQPPFEVFEQFKKFRQSFLNDSLTGASRKKGLEAPRHPFFRLADEYVEAIEPLQHFEVVFKRQLLEHLRDTLDEKKEEQQVLSYDDLLLKLREALYDRQRGGELADKLRQKYPIAMVDEFQDTDPSQYDIFKRIYSDERRSALFMIGDPKQSIYSFRGADVFSYLKAKKDAPEEKTFGLGRNFRSTPSLLEGFNTLFGRHDNPFILDRISYDRVEPGKPDSEYEPLTEYGQVHPPIRFRQLPMGGEDQLNKSTGADRAARDAAGEIYRLIEGGKKGDITIGEDNVQARDIAVLVRTHRQAALMADALRERGVKSVQYSQESVFDSEEAGQLELFLKAVVEPSNETLVKTALALPLTAYSGRDLYDIEEDEERWLSVLERFGRWHDTWQEKGFAAMFRSMLHEAQLAEHLIQYADGERRLTNLLHLGELMQAEAQRQKDGMRGLIKWLARKREEENGQQDEEQLRLESDQELVKIVTMHRSKGLEYPIVFCPFLWYGPQYQDRGQPLVYHDPEDLDTTFLDLNGKSDSDRSLKRFFGAFEELAESLRLAYVAMTRAEHCCHLSWAYGKQSEFSPLGYLLQDPDNALELLKETITGSYDAIGAQPFEKAIAELCEAYPGLFTMEAPVGEQVDEQQLELMNFGEDLSLEARSFDRVTPLESSYAISSFSSLSSWMEDEDPDMPDYDQFLDAEPVEERTEVPDMSMFGFPKGPQPGTCIHQIFEEIAFSSPENWEKVITESLSQHGIDPRWKNVLADMLEMVVGKPLLSSDEELRLSALEPRDMIPEMEFYYRNSDIQTSELLSIIRDGEQQNSRKEGGAAPGYLKGFIDLTFKFGDKYYLLDYKTNYLGDTVEDYQPDHLHSEMLEASYDLQYHIYTVALHRFLEKNLSDYSYHKHFGGAFYLFVRGINEIGCEGIYFDKPAESVIQTLNNYISGGCK